MNILVIKCSNLEVNVLVKMSQLNNELNTVSKYYIQL